MQGAVYEVVATGVEGGVLGGGGVACRVLCMKWWLLVLGGGCWGGLPDHRRHACPTHIIQCVTACPIYIMQYIDKILLIDFLMRCHCVLGGLIK